MRARILGFLWLCAMLSASLAYSTSFAENPAYNKAKQAVAAGKAESEKIQVVKTHPSESTKTEVKKTTEADAAKEAERLHKEVVAKSEKPEVYVARGMVFDNMKEYKNAIANYDFAIYLNPKLWQAYYQRALDKHILGDDTGALKDLEQVLLLNPKNAEAYYQRGQILNDVGQYTNALLAFDQAASGSIAIKPKALKGMGVANYYLKQYAESKKNFEAVIALDSNDANSYVWLGRLRTEVREYKDALELYNKAIAIDPRDSEAYLFKGRVLAFFMKDYDEGIIAFTKAIEANPDYADAYLQRAYAYNQKGNWKLAKTDFDKAVSLDSELKGQVLPAYRNDAKATK